METIKLLTRGLRQSNEFYIFFFFLPRLGTEISGLSEHKYNLGMYVCVYIYIWLPIWLPWWLRRSSSACNVGDSGLIPELGRAPGEGNSDPLQYSCLENPMDRGTWQAIVHEVTKSQMQLNN